MTRKCRKSEEGILVGLECASGPLSVAVLKGREVMSSVVKAEAPARVQDLTDTFIAAIGQARIGVCDIETIAVSIGPGSYTGIRSGIAFSKGLQVGIGCGLKTLPLTYAITEAIAPEGIIGAAVKFGRDEAAVEIFSGSKSVHFEIVSSERLIPTINRVSPEFGVAAWSFDARLEISAEEVPQALLRDSSSFAQLIGLAAFSAPPFEEARYLMSRF